MTKEQLRQLMYEKRLTPKMVAFKLYVTPAAVYNWLKGNRPIPKLAWEHLLMLTQEKSAMTIDLTKW